MTLTTTQYSALGDLKRFGHLVPARRPVSETRGTTSGYSRRTLQALVDAGFAQWQVHEQTFDRRIVPVVPEPEKLSERTYVVGIPLAVTVTDKGVVTLDFDLAEANDFDCYDRPWDVQATADSDAVWALLSTIRSHFALTLNLPQEAS